MKNIKNIPVYIAYCASFAPLDLHLYAGYFFIMEDEIWMPIKGYEGLYEVSHFGRIKGLMTWRGTSVRFNHIHDSGTKLTVSLYKKGKRVQAAVHRLVLGTFNCEALQGLECCHYDGNYKNNYIGNLRWDTRENNMADAIRHGTLNAPKGDSHYLSKLKTEDVINIKCLIKSGVKTKDIAIRYNVGYACICKIKNGYLWKHIA